MDLLATSGDITLSWTSPVYPKLYSNDSTINPLGRPISESEDGWIGSLLTLGAVIGPIIFSIIAEKFGRKIGILCVGFPHILSYTIMAFANDIYLFYFARLIGGIAVGGGYCLLPMYISEVSKETDRGKLSQSLNIFWALGNFIPYAIGPFISIKCFNLILALIPLMFFIMFAAYGTETPFYYLKVNKVDAAEKSLMHLRSQTKEEVQDELHEIKKFFKLNENGTLMDIIKNKTARRSFLICVCLICTQELSGFCAITFHLQLIFEAANTNFGADFSALIVGATILISSFMAPALVDRAGRRFLTITSCIGMCLAHVMIGSFFYVQDLTTLSTTSITWIPLFSLILYIVSFNFGICSVPWTLLSELFPNNLRQLASFSVSSLCWVMSFVMTSSFNGMNDVLGRAGTFWFFASACLMATTFCIIFVPETKGKTFVEIQEMLNCSSKYQQQNAKDEDEIMLQNSKVKT